MKHLFIKEYQLSINKFFIYSGILFSAMLLIPNWIYIIAFMYVFWLVVPAVYSEYNIQNDFTFMDTLPVSKKDIVTTKVFAIAFIEFLHVLCGILFSYINYLLYGMDKLFFDLNFAFFGNILIMYTIFNLIFFPRYFKTAFFFGKAAIFGSITAIFYVGVIEILNLFVKPINIILESPNYLGMQIGIFVLGLLLFISSLFCIIKISSKQFENKQ